MNIEHLTSFNSLSPFVALKESKRLPFNVYIFHFPHIYVRIHLSCCASFFFWGGTFEIQWTIWYLFDTRISFTWKTNSKELKKHERKIERFLVVFRHVFPEFLMNRILIWSLVYRSRFKYTWFDWNIHTQQSIDATPTFSFASICTAITIINNRYAYIIRAKRAHITYTINNNNNNNPIFLDSYTECWIIECCNDSCDSHTDGQRQI